MESSRWLAVIATFAAIPALAPAQTRSSVSQPIAIHDATIVTVSGPVIAKGTVLMRDGLIEAVGENIALPAEAWVIEGNGLTVYPGLMDAASSWGLPANLGPAGGGRGGRGGGAATAARGPEDRPATTSWLKAADEIQPTDARLERARNAGFTTAAAFPMRGIFCGQ